VPHNGLFVDHAAMYPFHENICLEKRISDQT
jgi:hypothetical protein